MALLLAPLLLLVGIPLGFHIGWYACDGRKGHPYNWRVFLGPASYFAWLGNAVPDWHRH